MVEGGNLQAVVDVGRKEQKRFVLNVIIIVINAEFFFSRTQTSVIFLVKILIFILSKVVICESSEKVA